MGKEMRRKLYFALKIDRDTKEFNIKVKFFSIFLATSNFYAYFCRKHL